MRKIGITTMDLAAASAVIKENEKNGGVFEGFEYDKQKDELWLVFKDPLDELPVI